MKVIGAGLGRTGTYSLKAALEMIGSGPCFHMTEVFAHPERAHCFTDALQGGIVEWDDVFRGYEATVDWPSCTFYAQLADHYPTAKVILTTRDPERWHRSCMQTIAWREGGSHADQEPGDDPVSQMIDTVIWRGTFDRRFDDEAYAIDVFERHNQEVRDRIPSGRLLEFEVSQGWEPLCRFLGADIPSEPFPRLNDTTSFRREILKLEE